MSKPMRYLMPAVAALSLTFGALATDYLWTTTDGLFQWPANWSPTGSPMAGDNAIFDNQSALNDEVLFINGSEVTHERLIVRRGHYQFTGNDESHTYTAPNSSDDGTWGFQVGTLGPSTLSLVGPSTHTTAQLVVGEGSGVNATLWMQDGPSITVTSLANIAASGFGALRIRDDCSFTANRLWIGNAGGSGGDVRAVDGGALTVTGDVLAGMSGSAFVTCESGSTIDVGGDFILGLNGLGDGTLFLLDGDSVTIDGTLRIADTGTGDAFMEGTDVSAQNVEIGGGPGYGDALMISGTLTTGNLDIALTPGGGRLRVDPDGNVEADQLNVGQTGVVELDETTGARLTAQSAAVDGEVTLGSGHLRIGSVTPVLGSGLDVGGSGADGELLILLNGDVSGGDARVGTFGGATGSVDVDGFWGVDDLMIGGVQSTSGLVSVASTGWLNAADVHIAANGTLEMTGAFVAANTVKLIDGVLTGHGTVVGTIDNQNGKIIVGGPSNVEVLDVLDSVPALLNTSDMFFEVQGATADRVYCDGPVTLGGTLHVETLGLPSAPGTTFEIIRSSTSVSGTFDAVVPAGAWQVAYIGTTVLITRQEPCATDFDDSGSTGFADLAAMLAAWGPCAGACPWDLDGSGSVGFADLSALLLAWGAC